jgi:hypothetical protein
MRNHLFAIAVSGTYVFTSGSALAHHSFAMFDRIKEIVLVGTVTQFQWTNPHTWIEMDVADEKGQAIHWSIEGGSVLGLSREGWKRDTVKVGDKVTLVAHPLKDGSLGGSLMGITLPDGKHLGAKITPDNALSASPPATTN